MYDRTPIITSGSNGDIDTVDAVPDTVFGQGRTINYHLGYQSPPTAT